MDKEICWNITARCNQNCKYCHRFLEIKDLTYEENKQILDNLINSGITDITWTGGEALLFPRINELIKYASSKGINNKLITNGKLLTKDIIDEIGKHLDSITLSIDSIDNVINEKLGRGYNHFETIKAILDYLKKYKDIKVRINCVACSYTKDGFETLINFLNNYEIYSLRVFKFMPLREKAVKNKDIFNISMDEYKKIIDLVNVKSNAKKIDTRIENDMESKYVLILANGDLVITKNGKDVIIGNALRDSIKSFLNN